MTSFVEKREEDIPHMHPCVSSSPKDSIMDFPFLIGQIWNQKSDTFAEIVKSGGHIRYVKMATTEGRLIASCQGSLVNLINRKRKKDYLSLPGLFFLSTLNLLYGLPKKFLHYEMGLPQKNHTKKTILSFQLLFFQNIYQQDLNLCIRASFPDCTQASWPLKNTDVLLCCTIIDFLTIYKVYLPWH